MCHPASRRRDQRDARTCRSRLWSCRPRMVSMPASSKSSQAGEIRPARCSGSDRSRARICVAFPTVSFGRPVAAAASNTLPGASAHRSLLASGTQAALANRLRFSASPWTTTTGRRNPGPEPVGSGNSARHTSSWEITVRRWQATGCQRRRGRRLRLLRPCRMPGSSRRRPRPAHGAQYIRRALRHKLRPGAAVPARPVVLRVRTSCRGWTRLPSYPLPDRFP